MMVRIKFKLWVLVSVMFGFRFIEVIYIQLIQSTLINMKPNVC